MEMLASLDNVPPKAKQFRNFTANSLNLRGNQANETGIFNVELPIRAEREGTGGKERKGKSAEEANGAR